MRRRGDSRFGTEAPKQPESISDSLFDRWWVQALLSAWMLFVVVTYFRLQLTRLIEIAGR